MNHCHHHPVYYDRTRRLGWGADWGQDDKDYLPGAKLSRIIDPQNYCCLRLQINLNFQNCITQAQFCLLYGGPQINIFKSSSTFFMSLQYVWWGGNVKVSPPGETSLTKRKSRLVRNCWVQQQQRVLSQNLNSGFLGDPAGFTNLKLDKIKLDQIWSGCPVRMGIRV